MTDKIEEKEENESYMQVAIRVSFIYYDHYNFFLNKNIHNNVILY